MTCIAILLVNLTGVALVPDDIKHINRAKSVCMSRYGSCMDKIEKVKLDAFRAYCGKDKKSLIFIK